MAARRVRAHTCPRCDQMRAGALYVKPDGKTARFCAICRRQLKRLKDETKKWDWCRALHVETGKRLYGINTQAHDHYYRTMAGDTDIIRALAIIQDNKCALAHTLFHYPDAAALVEFRNNTSLKRWRKTLPDHLLNRTPALVRINGAGDWVAGNMMLILYRVRDAYERCEGLADCRMLFDYIANATVSIPQQDTIARVKHDLMIRRMKGQNNKGKK